MFFLYKGISSALPGLTKRPHELFIAGAICEMIGLSECHGLASRVERRRLLIVFFIATAIVSALVPVTYDAEPYSKWVLSLIENILFNFLFSKYFSGFSG